MKKNIKNEFIRRFKNDNLKFLLCNNFYNS